MNPLRATGSDAGSFPSYFWAAPPPSLATAQVGQARTFSGVALSGEPVALGGVALVIDLASLVLPSSVPVLLQHDRDQRVGLATLAVRDGALHASGRLLSNPRAQALAADADEGFPWQLSVHVAAGLVTPVAAGAAVAVNGRDLTGPLLLWRQARLRELSFTPTGVDDQTSARILSLLGAAPAPLTDLPPETMLMSHTPPDRAGQPAPTGAPAIPGDASIAPALTEPAVAHLQAQLATAEARIQAAEQALLAAHQAQRRATLNQAFAALGLTPRPESLPHWLELSDAGQTALLEDVRLAAERGAATSGLFAELAQDGRPASGDADLIDRMAKL